jgi:sulfate adenylyltransferase subunit 2
MNPIDELEAEAIYILREVYAQFKRPAILFSGGKDSIVLTHLAVQAFYPQKMPFPLLHIDTGHNFPETIAFRDELVRSRHFELIIGSVQESIDQGKATEETGPEASRNSLQTITLRDTICKLGLDACIGGGRRDEEKARAKERVFSHRDVSGQWRPDRQRPELWHHYNGLALKGEHFRIFPLSNWTELDIWSYIQRENIQLPSLYFAHDREIIRRNGSLLSVGPYLKPRNGEQTERLTIRFRTCGDMPITGAIESKAQTTEEVMEELKLMRTSERGSRADDQRSETAMEDRKREGYF